MTIEEYLKQLGLSDKEARAYLALLELGESQIVPIAKKTATPRTSLVYILEKLRDRGMITILEHNSRRVYEAVAPRKIVTLLKSEQEKLSENIYSLEQSLPELERVYKLNPFQPKVRFFQGQEEIRRLYNEILDAPIDEAWYVSEIKKIENVLGKQFLKSWIKRRIALHIKSKAIWVRSEAVLDEPSYLESRANARSVRYAPEGFQAPAHTLIYGDNVITITTAKENVGTVITSRDFATTMKSWFHELWKVSSEN